MRTKEKAAAPESLGFLLLQLRAAMRVELDRGVKQYRVKGAHWPVLAILHWGEADKVTDIARLLQLDATGVTRLVDRLEAMGLVERRPHKTDRRVKIVELTAAGRKLMKQLEPVALNVDATFLARLSPGEARQFVAAVKKMLGEGGGDGD